MCGFAGILGDGSRSEPLLRAMAASLDHRGPDDQGIWSDAEAGIGLASRRLAIVDLSPMGHQPMASADGRFVISYNGEIYNHRAIRAELDGERTTAWRGHSDTETLVEAIAAWGLRGALDRAVGMFALALWDRRERTLMLARDRFGEKPLYYGWVGGDFVFGSELKALRLHPRFANEMDRRALRLLMARAYIPAPFSVYERVFKLLPGCILTATPEAIACPTLEPPIEGKRAGGLSLDRYWSYRDTVNEGLKTPFTSEGEALEALEAALTQAVGGQSVADVSVGAFLSGGIDSSTIVGLYQTHAPGRVKTFTIGFEEAGFDETIYARQVAAHFGTEHHERYVSFADAQAVIPLLPTIYDEPFADSSQIPTYLVSRQAREHVTVALSGDGGDELFGGYRRYFATARLWDILNRLPRSARKAAGGMLAAFPPSMWNGLVAMLPSGRRPPHFGTRVQKAFRTVRDVSSFEQLMTTFLDEWNDKDGPILPRAGFPPEASFDLTLSSGAPNATRMMYGDATSYLPDDILCKVDRAAMAVSLETRVPFLDHRVAAAAARIPISMQIDGGTGKLMLRKLLARHAPPAMFNRPKAGFAVPVGEWLKGPLRGWAEDLLDPAKIRALGYLDGDKVSRRWHEHLSGRTDSTQALWTVLMWRSWMTAQQAL
ncbi:MAG: asparagine synthase (glutamine-hydrolyzing) [Sphingomicrobium sp.]|nr:asparagine synthase (glutamine-hydrolyzing) [Sphingomonadales bacterium]